MKAVKKATLVLANLVIPVKIMPILSKEAHLVPKEIEVHRECGQEIKKEWFCPVCKKLFVAIDGTKCPSCGEVFEPEVETYCRECKTKVESAEQDNWCPRCKKRLKPREIEKVFLLEEDKLMKLTSKEKKDWENLLPDKKKIEVKYVILKRGISALYFDKVYALAPEKKGIYEYVLLKEILGEEMALVAEVVLKAQHYRALIYPEKNVLLLITLNPHDKIVLPKIPEIEFPFDLVEMGKEAIFQISSRRFRPEEHTRDMHREYLEMLIEKKIKGKKVSLKPPIMPPPEILEEISKDLKKALDKLKK